MAVAQTIYKRESNNNSDANSVHTTNGKFVLKIYSFHSSNIRHQIHGQYENWKSIKMPLFTKAMQTESFSPKCIMKRYHRIVIDRLC